MQVRPARRPRGGDQLQDLWWNAPPGSESGWGLNLAHQGNTLFVTWFTYDLDGSPLWLSATAQKTATARRTPERFTARPDPAFDAAPWNPGGVTVTPVGTATLTFADGNHATFAYTVNARKPGQADYAADIPRAGNRVQLIRSRTLQRIALQSDR